MEDNNSEARVAFGFGKPNLEENKQKNDNEKVEVQQKENVKTITVQEDMDNRANEPYLDERSVTVALVRNYSKYREANRTALPKRVDFIGSSVSSSRTLSSNKIEVETYFPRLLGLSPNDPNFINRVKQYLNNIQIKVDEIGKTFNTSFRYNHKKDYDKIVKKEEAIDAKYNATNRQNLSDLKAALKYKLDSLNELEASKCTLGEPVNLEQYLMYRHCLLYNDIAKDTAIINSDISIRFYFKDDKKEANKLKKLRQEINKAKTNYVTCLSDEVLFDAIYIQYCVINDKPIVSSLLEDRLQREIKLDGFSQVEPVKFNKLFNDKDVRLASTIEHLIARGELIRSQYNQNISTIDGVFIGANMLETISWFKNPENASIVEVYKNKLKNI